MISEWEARQLISKERKAIRRMERGTKTDFHSGMLHAFQVSDNLLKFLAERSRSRQLPYHTRRSHWKAEEFYQAIETSYNYLMRCERKRAITRLRGILEKVKAEQTKLPQQKTPKIMGLPQSQQIPVS